MPTTSLAHLSSSRRTGGYLAARSPLGQLTGRSRGLLSTTPTALVLGVLAVRAYNAAMMRKFFLLLVQLSVLAAAVGGCCIGPVCY